MNQCWKDSWNSIVHPDGAAGHAAPGLLRDPGVRLRRAGTDGPAGPRGAGATRRWPTGWSATRPRCEASFDQDFWLPDAGFYALALDGDKQPVPTLTSNIGHLLWSGIVADERVEPVVAHLVGEQHVLRLGRAHAGRRAAGRTTRSSTTTARSGRTTPR